MINIFPSFSRWRDSGAAIHISQELNGCVAVPESEEKRKWNYEMGREEKKKTIISIEFPKKKNREINREKERARKEV